MPNTPSTPSLAQNVSWEGLFCPPPALCLVFRAMEGSVHAQHALPCLKRKLVGPFCPHLPSVSHFEWRALFTPTKPSLA